jgi:hypothetical protein
MTTEALVETVLSNPLANLIPVYVKNPEDKWGTPYKIMRDSLNCLRELDSRPDGLEKLEAYASVKSNSNWSVLAWYLMGMRTVWEEEGKR